MTSHPIARKKLENGHCTVQRTHLIPTGGTLNQTVSDGVLIVGDAAGQVKSTTGGGMYYGMICAKIAGRVISKALSSLDNVLKRKSLIEYQKLWQKQLGKEIAMSAKLRFFFDTLSDDEVNFLFQVIRKNKELINEIEAVGDIDWQSKLLSPLLKYFIGPLMKKPQLLLKLRTFLVF
jgi:flavin-dependent dehydrogenase